MYRWKDFELLDAGNGEKLERWGKYILRRPDPQAIWPLSAETMANAIYHRNSSGGGGWENNQVPAAWQVSYPGICGKLTFNISLMGFKHTGLFPEQSYNWDFMQTLISKAKAKESQRPIRILNLFAYSGGASLACAAAGADEVVHVDASKKMNKLAQLNVKSSKLDDKYIRFINEDVNKFVERELRRGREYEGIIMDPPAYGRGPSGELWQLENAVFPLVEKCSQLLSKRPLFFILNTYTTGLTAGALQSILQLAIVDKFQGRTEALELLIPASYRNFVLPCGCTGRWQP